MTHDTIITGELEIVENQYLNRDYEVEIHIPEFTCVCPKTGQPDFATIEICYIPDAYIVELRSLKLYLQTYRNRARPALVLIRLINPCLFFRFLLVYLIVIFMLSHY